METVPCICIFSALYLPSMGGVETYTFHLARALVAQGKRVIVVTLNTQEQKEHTIEEGVEIIRLPCWRFLNNRYPLAKKNETYRQLWEWLELQPINYVAVNTRFYTHSYWGLAFARKKGVVPLLIEHGSAHLTMGNPLIDAGVQLVEHAITNAERHFHASHYAVSAKASDWLSHFNLSSHGELSNSIDADAYAASASSRDFRVELNLPANTFVVAFVGRLVGEKGILELAQAIQTWTIDKPLVVLAAGEGPLHEVLKTYESERFHLLGKLSREEVAALFSQANIMCLPSRSEGFATSLLEAAACYTPAITTNVGGVDELISSDKYGTVIPDRKPETIRKALEEAVQDLPRTAAQGQEVGKLVRTYYSWDKTAQHVLTACQQIQS